MSTHRYTVCIGVAGLAFGVILLGQGPSGVHAQAPPRSTTLQRKGFVRFTFRAV